MAIPGPSLIIIDDLLIDVIWLSSKEEDTLSEHKKIIKTEDTYIFKTLFKTLYSLILTLTLQSFMLLFLFQCILQITLLSFKSCT